MASEYAAVADHYDAIQEHVVDYGAEIAAVHTILRAHAVRSVLDVACGTGTHLLGLAALGYECAGRDLSPEMLEVARRKARDGKLALELRTGDLREYALGRRYDAVLALYALSTLDGDAELRRAFVSARRALRDGGIFYFNLLNAESSGPAAGAAGAMVYVDVALTTPEARVVRLNRTVFAGEVQDWTAIYLIDEGGGARLVVGQHRLRHHHLDHVRRELGAAGFELLDASYSDVHGLERLDMRLLARARPDGHA